MDQISNWLTSKEAMELSGYSESGLRRARNEERVTFKQKGRIFLYYREDVEKLRDKRAEQKARKKRKKKD